MLHIAIIVIWPDLVSTSQVDLELVCEGQSKVAIKLIQDIGVGGVSVKL